MVVVQQPNGAGPFEGAPLARQNVWAPRLSTPGALFLTLEPPEPKGTFQVDSGAEMTCTMRCCTLPSDACKLDKNANKPAPPRTADAMDTPKL